MRIVFSGPEERSLEHFARIDAASKKVMDDANAMKAQLELTKERAAEATARDMVKV
jgi:hypothetical protein